jgi:hypothetical protein
MSKVTKVFYIYVYDSVRGWVKITSNPKNGYVHIELTFTPIMEMAEKYPEREFTVMEVTKTIQE